MSGLVKRQDFLSLLSKRLNDLQGDSFNSKQMQDRQLQPGALGNTRINTSALPGMAGPSESFVHF